MEDPRTIVLPEKDIPEAWYNVLPDMPEPLAPPLHPVTREPIGPADLAPLFPMGLIEQEVSPERHIPIPDEVREIYKLWRPTPFCRAYRLEKALGTPAKIYFKNESVSPVGSHKPNTAVPQAYYNKAEGNMRLFTETGAGQWGAALAMGCNFFGMELQVFMVRVSYQQKPYRRSVMQVFGAKVEPSPSHLTEAGRKLLVDNPENPGSLGMAISDAVEMTVKEGAKYSLGSVLNHVLLHQTVVGLEAKKAFEMIDESPDIVIACCGGGSNLGGTTLPFLTDKMNGKDIRLIAVEPASCATLTEGRYEYDFGDSAGMAPMLLMYTLGHDFVPPSSHAGGLRYHGDSPIISSLVKHGHMEAVAYHQTECFDAAVQFARCEGLIPAPETSHAIRCAIDEALRCKETGEAKTIFFNFSGHGFLDMSAYDEYFSGNMINV
ncbi:MAG: TrpB-like pyridoxal phosphate-dependent enzyme [Candidatus Geothermincolia bacterium]